jgi:superfamily II DNA or RNA helicase
MFSSLHFQHEFRKYQQMVLEIVARESTADHKHHIVAPPGAGKTIVGLELIRRFGRPAVVFTPTTTIQQQWVQKVGLFTTDQDWLDAHVSLDANHLADITILTYQVLSTPGENLAFVEKIAIDRWAEDLLKAGLYEDEAAAYQRIATLQESNPKAAKNEISKRYRRVKREFLQDPNFDGRKFLHANARDLIDRIVALGVGTIVLDECHHLLDYWAFILRELIRELPDARIVGLTATLPDPANQTEYENYHSLLGDVDFEVPTPAVVKEGNLAPFRDLVYFVEPSRREMAYLNEIQTHFETAVSIITATPAFHSWVDSLLHPPDPAAITDFFNKEPLLCIAAVKFSQNQERPLPPHLPIIAEMLEPMTIDDWLTLLESYGLRVLKISKNRQEQAQFRQLRDALLGFGITITERGIRHQRSPGDLVLALSEAKDEAVVKILQAEQSQLGQQLRAVVITDYERMSAKTRRLKHVLDPDAGSAVRVFRRLVAETETAVLNPVLVTGKVVLASVDYQAILDRGIREWVENHDMRFTWSWEPTEVAGVVTLKGQGADWASRTYVALLTALFEQGITRCLVGTRGIFGEGWDALSLNTLVDLTAVTTSTGVRQIRGRSIRLDPNWPRKVAHNWDVVCVSTKFDKGDSDFKRFVAKHAHTWGIVVRSKALDIMGSAADAILGMQANGAMEGRIVRGVWHVDLALSEEMCLMPFKKIRFAQVNRRMLKAVKERSRVYDLWEVGEPYSNFSYHVSQIAPRDIKFQTVFRIQETLRAMAWRIFANILAVAFLIWIYGGQALAALPGADPLFLVICLLVLVTAGVLAGIAVNTRDIIRLFRRTFMELPVDDVLLDMGQALLLGLRSAGLVSQGLNEKYVRVVKTEAGGLQVFLDYASPEDSQVFIEAFQQLLGPLGDARYLIERDSGSVRNPVLRLVWVLVRQFVQLDVRAYHRVPDVLATKKNRAEAFAQVWQRFVGGGRLIYTRHEEGRQILLAARGQQHGRIRQVAFELWR